MMEAAPPASDSAVSRELSSVTTPISRLPDELLVEIFLRYRSLWDRHRTFTRGEDIPHYGWIRITHVCRRWREVATNAPLLWTDILVTTPQCVETMLSRTGSVLYQLEGSLSCSVLGRFAQDCPLPWKIALSASSRVHALTIKVDSNDFVNLEDEQGGETRPDWSDTVQEQFPNLKILELLATNNFLGPIDVLPPMFDQHASLSLKFLSADMFSLRALRPLLTSSLRSLSLFNFDNADLTWEALLECLSGLTSLYSLTIDDPCPTRPFDIEELPLILDRPIVLPSLRFLKTHIDDPGAVSGLLLRNLQLPANTHLNIEYGIDEEDEEIDGEDWEDEEDELHVLMQALSMRLSGELTIGPPSPILTLGYFDNVKVGRSNWTEIRGWTSSWPLKRFPKIFTKIEAAEVFSFLLRITGFSAEVRQASLSSLGPLDTVTTLAIDCDAEYLGLREGLAHLTNVSAIWVSGRALPDLLDALVPRPPEYPSVLFPNLESLHISTMCCTMSANDDQPSEDMWHLMVTLRALSHVGGCPVKTLILSKCYNVPDIILALLSELVEEVIWDRRVLHKDVA